MSYNTKKHAAKQQVAQPKQHVCNPKKKVLQPEKHCDATKICNRNQSKWILQPRKNPYVPLPMVVMQLMQPRKSPYVPLPMVVIQLKHWCDSLSGKGRRSQNDVAQLYVGWLRQVSCQCHFGNVAVPRSITAHYYHHIAWNGAIKKKTRYCGNNNKGDDKRCSHQKKVMQPKKDAVVTTEKVMQPEKQVIWPLKKLMQPKQTGWFDFCWR